MYPSAKVVVVDDNESGRYAMVRSLQKAGHHVWQAATAAECRQVLKTHSPDILVLDVNLPDGSGIDLCRDLRVDPSTADVRIIQTSALFTGKEDRILGLESGADVYLVTPFEPRELLAQVSSLLRVRQAEVALKQSEQRFKLLFEGNPDPFFVVDTSGRLILANRACEAMSGYPMHELLQLPLKDLCAPDQLADTQASFENCIGKRTALSIETAMLRKDGGRVELRMSGNPLIEPDGRLVVYCSAHDITLEKQAESIVHHNFLELEAIYKHAPLGFCIFDRQMRFRRINDRLAELNGIKPEAHIGKTVRELLPDIADQVETAMRSLLETRKPLRFEIRGSTQATPEGEHIWDEYWFPLLAANGSVESVGVIVEDVTETRRAEEAIKASTERFRAVLENSLDAAYRRDLRTDTYDYLSPVVEQVMGINAEKMRNMGVMEILARMHPDDRETALQAVNDGMRSGKGRIEYRLLDDAGKYRWLADHFTVQTDDTGKPMFRSGTVRDISAHKQAEADLRAALAAADFERKRLAVVLKALPVGLGIADASGRVELFNGVLAQIWGGPPTPKSTDDYGFWRARWVDSGKPVAAQDWAMAQALKTGHTVEGQIVEIEKFDGSGTATIVNSAAPIMNDQGDVVGGIVTEVDITKQVEAQRRLHESEERLRLAQAAGRIGIHDYDPVSGTLHWDSLLRELWGLGPNDPINYDVFMAGVHPEDRSSVQEAIDSALDPKGSGYCHVEYRLAHPRARCRWVAATGHATFKQGKAVRLIGTVQDITRQKEFQSELERLVTERTAKLQELVGELEHFSYSITHDMRAPLRAMRGFAEIVDEMLADGADPELKVFIERIMTSAERMDLLITDALNYSKAVRQELPLAPVDPGTLLRGMLDTYPEFQPSRAGIHIEGELPSVLANEAGLTQCFSNLLGNAVKFVRDDERPEIRIWAEEIQRSGDHSAENWVRIWVEDQGIGISPNMMPKVFNMFVRESQRYEGTGIGLALVRKVTQRMGGRVGVLSEPGRGSRFWLELRQA